MQYSDFWNGSKSFYPKRYSLFFFIQPFTESGSAWLRKKGKPIGVPLYTCDISQRTFTAWARRSRCVWLKTAHATLDSSFRGDARPPPAASLLRMLALGAARGSRGVRGGDGVGHLLKLLLRLWLFSNLSCSSFLLDLCIHHCGLDQEASGTPSLFFVCSCPGSPQRFLHTMVAA